MQSTKLMNIIALVILVDACVTVADVDARADGGRELPRYVPRMWNQHLSFCPCFVASYVAV